MLFLCSFERFGLSLSASRRFAFSDTACCSFLTMTSEVQGERRAELARAMLSRSLHSRCISNALQRYNIREGVLSAESITIGTVDRIFDV